MKYVIVLALVAMAMACASGASTMSAPMAPVAPKKDPFISLIKDIEASDFFPNLSVNRRLLTFEMLSAAETKHLEALFDKIGYVVILEYLDDLPEDYQHQFIMYSVDHLKVEKEYYGEAV